MNRSIARLLILLAIGSVASVADAKEWNCYWKDSNGCDRVISDFDEDGTADQNLIDCGTGWVVMSTGGAIGGCPGASF
ncbi:MAG: hypothetical protein HKN71_07345 [Gemmatimonadetes bacterium]|nr:hypothetical protein [Gemmatimonadota bacterium]